MGTETATCRDRLDIIAMYIPEMYPVGETEKCSSWSKGPDIANVALSCLLPSTGPYKFAIIPLGAAMA